MPLIAPLIAPLIVQTTTCVCRYAHAEARKSPVVDGKVMRNARGREVRYPVILTAAEKAIARTIVLAFGQTLCGFDLLRSNGKSYVCDVNGWSFVKDSQKFWDDSANLFRQYCLEQLAPAHLARHPQPSSQLVRSPLLASFEGPSAASSVGLPVTSSLASVIGADSDGELLCVVAFIRHGDRTPKQKLKFLTREPTLLSMILEHGSSPREELKIKKVRTRQRARSRSAVGHWVATPRASAPRDAHTGASGVPCWLLFQCPRPSPLACLHCPLGASCWLPPDGCADCRCA